MGKEYATRKRTAIMKYLEDHKEQGITAGDVIRYLEEDQVEMNKTTVYRYLDKLTEQKKVRKFPSEDGKTILYQFVENHGHCHEHLHIRCIKCGKVLHLDCDYMREFNVHLKEHHGYALLFEKSILCGVCEKCGK